MKDKQYNGLKYTQSENMDSFVQHRYNLGLMANATWNRDPKRLLFSLSRYKFVSKMLSGSSNVLEIGCGDGWNAKIVAEVVQKLTLTDYCDDFVNEAAINSSLWGKNVHTQVIDFINSSPSCVYDAAYCLDVFEHIDRTKSFVFLNNISKACQPYSKIIVGIPSLNSQQYISESNKDPGHINCLNQDDFIELMNRVFNVVLPFSMNDEVLHTGYGPMSQYLFAVCIN